MPVPLHGWRECRPAVIKILDARHVAETPLERQVRQVLNDQVVELFLTLPDADRAAYHRVCCLNRKDNADMASVRRFRARVEVLKPPENI